ncbi:unnamed protein product [Symbiodinium natans]|uniref:Uncharacterized protein n=1 Tax=Symbiodinium natans TaxID=878477 RepID=A0A812M1N1_9DINO|nr:unnamed protein product [Symbiodinium natans]
MDKLKEAADSVGAAGILAFYSGRPQEGPGGFTAVCQFYSGEAAYQTGKLFCYRSSSSEGKAQLKSMTEAGPDEARKMAHRLCHDMSLEPHKHGHVWPNGCTNRASFMFEVVSARVRAYPEYFASRNGPGAIFYIEHNEVNARDDYFSDGGKLEGANILGMLYSAILNEGAKFKRDRADFEQKEKEVKDQGTQLASLVKPAVLEVTKQVRELTGKKAIEKKRAEVMTEHARTPAPTTAVAAPEPDEYVFQEVMAKGARMTGITLPEGYTMTRAKAIAQSKFGAAYSVICLIIGMKEEDVRKQMPSIIPHLKTLGLAGDEGLGKPEDDPAQKLSMSHASSNDATKAEIKKKLMEQREAKKLGKIAKAAYQPTIWFIRKHCYRFAEPGIRLPTIA